MAAGGDRVPRFRKGVKQVSTLGPASWDPAVLEDLFLEGTDVFRLNLSHRGPELKKTAAAIRSLEAKYDHPIGILADLQGPKHRVGMFGEDRPKVALKQGQKYTFDLDTASFGSESRVSLPHPEVLAALEVGNAILIDDGKLRCLVTGKGEGYVETVIQNDGTLSSRKGFNLPDTVIPGEAMTPKDVEDLEFILTDLGVTVDWIALSFVQRPEDMEELKDRIGGRSDAKLLAKLEKPQAVAPGELERIVTVCDGIMVARGDLGVEMPPEDVPLIQKEIIEACRAQGKPVIVATQMLESMIDAPAPTRAECSDIATAIFDGCDAVMLSGESAAGKYPREAVAMQRRLISRVETAPRFQHLIETSNLGGYAPALAPTDAADADIDAILKASADLAIGLRVKAICVFTRSGHSARRLSRLRPNLPILAVTPDVHVARALALSAGLYPAVIDPSVLVPIPGDDENAALESVFTRMLEEALNIARTKGLIVEPSDRLVCTSGCYNFKGVVSNIRVIEANSDECWGPLCDVP